ncbi:hypothetical protein M9434_006863 [Picochlorum sp. BPE23]|nr:hypothetical protein M9434_006863 [Picochlorum sp. BPE23]
MSHSRATVTAQIETLADVDRLLRETVATEQKIDEELEELLMSQGKDVLESVTTRLQQVTADRLSKALEGVHELSRTTRETADMADAVSFKIRNVDMKQSRVREALRRIDGIQDRVRAIDGCKKAIDADDVGVAVGCVSQFWDIVEESGGEDEEMEKQRDMMKRYAKICEERVREKTREAMEGKNHDMFTTYVQMFGPLRLQKEGLKYLEEYIGGLVWARAQQEYDALVDGFSLTGAKVTYVDALSNVLKDVAQSIDEYVEVMRDAFGPEYALEGVHALHKEADVRGTRVLKRFIEEKGLVKMCSQINNRIDGSMTQDTLIDARKVEPLLMDLLVMCTRGEEYIQFVLQCMVDAAAPNDVSPSLETSVRGGDFGSSLREILSYYISLEEYYVEESVSKAIEIDEAVHGSLTSSMVDDSFYILLSSGKRALSTGRAPSTVAILNQINTVISSLYRSSLVKKLQGCPSKLASCAPSSQQEKYNPNADKYAIIMNDVDLSASYIDKLRAQLDDIAGRVFASSSNDYERVRLVLADLSKTSADMKKLAEQATEQLSTSIMSKLRPILDAFVANSYELSDDEAVNDGWSVSLIQAFEQAFTWLQNILSPELYDKVIESSVDKIVSRMEASVAQKQFSQLGGLQLEKDVRSLIIGLSESTTVSMRDKFSRLQQIATVLGVETAAEATDLIGDSNIAWKLTSLDVRQMLNLRIDFSQSDIASVKLHI